MVMRTLFTAAILLTWTGLAALWGNPKYVYSNAGTNLISAAKIMDSLSLEWKIITKVAAIKGTRLKVASSGAQWRSYLSEYRVMMLKSSIKHLHI